MPPLFSESAMAAFTLCFDLTPVPGAPNGRVRLACHVFGAGDPVIGIADRIAGLKKELANLPGDFPAAPVNSANGQEKDWTKIDDLFKRWLGELLPWTWSELKLTLVSADKRMQLAQNDQLTRLGGVGDPVVLSPDGINVAQRGLIRAIWMASGKFADPSNFLFNDGTRALAAGEFQFVALSGHATSWPAPIPQEALGNVINVEFDRALIDPAVPTDGGILPDIGSRLGLLVEFAVSGRVYAPVPGSEQWTTGAGSIGSPISWKLKEQDDQVISVTATTLPRALLLHPPGPGDSFVDPYGSLWLTAPTSSAIGDHDWWSRLHEGIGRASDMSVLIAAALRGAPTDAPALNGAFGDSLFVFCATLRDVMAPGLACVANKSPPTWDFDATPWTAQVLSIWRFDEGDVPPNMVPILQRGDSWPDFQQQLRVDSSHRATQRLALLRCILQREASNPPSASDWIRSLMKYSITLARLLGEIPSDQPVSAEAIQRVCGALDVDERLRMVDAIRREALLPQARLRALLDDWDLATQAQVGDAPDLAAARKLGALLVADLKRTKAFSDAYLKLDPSSGLTATAALDTVNNACAVRKDDPPNMPLDARIARALTDSMKRRLKADSILAPRLAVSEFTLRDSLDLSIQTAIASTAAQAAKWILASDEAAGQAVARTGNPGPLTMQIDSLHDNGKMQGHDIDQNFLLRGYSAFMRRTTPAVPGAAGSAITTDWACGHVGQLLGTMWPPDGVAVQALGGSPVRTLAVAPATMSNGVRQVLLHHDQRPWLPTDGIDVVASNEASSDPSAMANYAFQVIFDPITKLSKLPMLAFGAIFDVLLFAQARGGALPPEIAGLVPYAMVTDDEVQKRLTKLASNRPEILHCFRYLRQVPVSPPRLTWDGAAWAATSKDVPSGWLVPLRGLTPMNAVNTLALASTAWPADDNSSGNPTATCLLLSRGKLSATSGLQAWQRVTLTARPPAATFALYDRWVALDQLQASTDKPAGQSLSLNDRWQAWRQRVFASELLRQTLAAGSETDTPKSDSTNALSDPAVSALIVNWRSLRSVVAGEPQSQPTLLPLFDPKRRIPPDTEDVHANTSETDLLQARLKANPPDWQIAVMVADPAPDGMQRFSEPDLANHILRVWLRPGEIGELTVTSAVASSDVIARFHQSLYSNQTPTVDGFSLFSSWSMRFEVGTPDFIDSGELFDHCFTRVNAASDISLWWMRGVWGPDTSPPAEVDANMLAVHNVGGLVPTWQEFRGTGRPLPCFPHDEPCLDQIEVDLKDGSPDPSANAVQWDATGFGERYEDAVTQADMRRIDVGAATTLLHRMPSQNISRPRYVRYGVSARHRYADVYLALVVPSERQCFSDVSAQRSAIVSVNETTQDLWTNSWLRAFAPATLATVPPTPLVRLVVPLTRSFSDQDVGDGGDLLVMLNEELDASTHLATRLEAVVELVTREYPDGATEKLVPVSSLEAAPDPILEGAPGMQDFVALECMGPVGHTFDTNSRDPRFSSVSYIVRAAPRMRSWDFAKLSFRRVTLPEMTCGYYAPVDDAMPGEKPRISMVPGAAQGMLPGLALSESGGGHISLQGLPGDAGPINLRLVLAMDNAPGPLVISILCTAAQTNGMNQRTWTAKGAAPLPSRAAVTNWSVLQSFSHPPKAGLPTCSARALVTRVRPAQPEKNTPAQWEIAIYVQAASRRVATNLDGTSPAMMPWDRRWDRIATWYFDEPAAFAAGQIQFTADNFKVDHVAASAQRFTSDYTTAEWTQTIARATRLAIAGTPWTGSLDQANIVLKVPDRSVQSLQLLDTGTGKDAELAFKTVPTPSGQTGQGLFHRLLVTREICTTDGFQSEDYVGMFKQASSADSRFVPAENEPLAWLPPNVDPLTLRGYVLLFQQDTRSTAPTPEPGQMPRVDSIWALALCPHDVEADAQNTQDATVRLVGISPPIPGIN